MYLKDKAVRVTLRLTAEQFEFIKRNSDMLGVSPSEFLRMMVNAVKAQSDVVEKHYKKAEEHAAEELGMMAVEMASDIADIGERKVEGRANDETCGNNLV